MKHWSSSFSRKKKRGQKIQGVKVFLDHIIIHEGPLPPSFCPSLSRATLKGCISTVALSLSLSLARAKAAAARVFWSVDAETTTPTVAEAFLFPNEGERERDTQTKTISIIYTQIRSIASESDPETLCFGPKRPPRKKKISNTNAIEWHYPYLLLDLDALRNRRRRQSRRSHHHHLLCLQREFF